MDNSKHLLFDYIPESTVNQIDEWFNKNNVQLKISRARLTKLGDYRVANNGKSQLISVNYDLNPYAFLITLVHEMAHAEVWKHKKLFRRIKPHGKEWRQTFSQMMEPFLNENVFPKNLLPAVEHYFQKPKASSVSDPRLMKALKNYDQANGNLQLNDFVSGDRFLFRNSSFEVIKKLRTRYQCKNLDTNRLYLIHGLAEVKKLKDEI